jgi:hypothetical protein
VNFIIIIERASLPLPHRPDDGFHLESPYAVMLILLVHALLEKSW